MYKSRLFCHINFKGHILFIYLFILQSDIVDVNEIFKDLAIMVHEQGETIGT